MDMKNVAVAVVMEVMATTIAPQVPDEEATSPMLVHDDLAVVVVCPQTNEFGNSGHSFLVEPCEGPTSWVGTAIAA